MKLWLIDNKTCLVQFSLLSCLGLTEQDCPFMNSFILLSSFAYNFLNRWLQTELDYNRSLPFHICILLSSRLLMWYHCLQGSQAKLHSLTPAQKAYMSSLSQGLDTIVSAEQDLGSPAEIPALGSDPVRCYLWSVACYHQWLFCVPKTFCSQFE